MHSFLLSIKSFIKRGGHWYLLSSILSKFSALVLIILLAKNLSAEAFGKISQYLSLSAILIPLISLSAQETYLYFASKKECRISEKINLLHSLLFFSSIVFFAITFLYFFIGYLSSRIDLELYVFVFYSFIFSQTTLLIYYFRVIGLNKLFSLAFMMQNVFLLSIVCIFLLFPTKFISVAWSLSIIVFLFYLFFFIFSRRINHKILTRSSKLPSSMYIKYSLSITLGVFSSITIFHLDIIAVGFFVGDADAGFYRLMTMLPIVILFIPSSFLASDFKHLVSISNDFDKIVLYYCNYLKLFVPISLVLAVIVYLSVPHIVLFMSGLLPDNTWLIGLIFSISVFFNFLLRAPLGTIFNSMGLVSLNVKISVFVFSFNVVSVIVLTKIYGMPGAALSTLLSFMLGAFISLFLFYKMKYNFKKECA